MELTCVAVSTELCAWDSPATCEAARLATVLALRPAICHAASDFTFNDWRLSLVRWFSWVVLNPCTCEVDSAPPCDEIKAPTCASARLPIVPALSPGICCLLKYATLRACRSVVPSALICAEVISLTCSGASALICADVKFADCALASDRNVL